MSVRGSTVDTLFYNPDISRDDYVKAEVDQTVWEAFLDDANINSESLMDIIPRGLCDIHFTVLFEPDGRDIQSESLAMSSDSKYLIAINDKYNCLTWDMKTGKPVKLENSENIEWVRGIRGSCLINPFSPEQRYYVVDKNNSYYATVAPSNMIVHETFFSSDIKKGDKAIVLFQRPGGLSCYGQVAFCNSIRNLNELKKLRDSNTVKKIESFAQDNLKRIINQRIEYLTPLEDRKKDS